MIKYDYEFSKSFIMNHHIPRFKKKYYWKGRGGDAKKQKKCWIGLKKNEEIKKGLGKTKTKRIKEIHRLPYGPSPTHCGISLGPGIRLIYSKSWKSNCKK